MHLATFLVYNSIGISGKDDNFTNDWQFLQNSLTLGGKFDFMTMLLKRYFLLKHKIKIMRPQMFFKI